MIDWEALEAAGHNFTMVSGMVAGRSTYYCENCGALLIVTFDAIEVFHVHRGSPSTQERCHANGWEDSKNLKTKLDEMQQRALERLKEI